MNDWLTNLQKAHETPALPAAPVSKLAAAEQKLPNLLRTLLQSDSDMLDADTPEVLDPVSTLVAKLHNERYGVPAIAPPHKDGVTIEKCNGQIFHFTHVDGRLIKTEVFDPSLPGGHEVIEHRTPAYIPTMLAKIIGCDEESMHDDRGLAGYVPVR